MNIPVNSIPELFQNQVAKYGRNKTCVTYKNNNNTFVKLTWQDLNEEIMSLACYLLNHGVSNGDRVAIFSSNRYEWWVCDQAILSIGAIVVPIYSTNTTEETKYVLNHSESKVCICGSSEQTDKVLGISLLLDSLNEIISIDVSDKNNITLYRDIIRKTTFQQNVIRIKELISTIKPDDLATIVYTSGTTGQPKGVMLTHSNLLHNAYQLTEALHADENDIWISFLPLSHALERMAGYYVPVRLGGEVCFIKNFGDILTDMGVIRPSMLMSVPRLFEKIHNGILTEIATSSQIKKILFRWAISIGEKNIPNITNNTKASGYFAFRYWLADKLVLSKIRKALGMDRFNVYISGGGPLSVFDNKFFLGIGVKILEGFGLTEAAPVTNVNLQNKIKIGSVGPALPETEIKITDDGEILFRGPQIMIGYYKNQEATKNTFTNDGFLKSGDIGILDEDNYLIITGRIKDIIVTSGGKNISPQNIENSIKNSKYIEQIALIGDKRKFLSALIIPNINELSIWAKENNIDFESTKELLANQKTIDFISKEIDFYTEEFARVEKIKNFKLLNDEWSPESGELTQTLKIKRKIIEQKYSEIIESMYQE